MKGGDYPFSFAALSFPDSKKVSIYFTAGLQRERERERERERFQSSHGEVRVRTHDLTATCCTVTEPL